MKKSRFPELPEFARDAEQPDAGLADALAALCPPPKVPPQLLRERLLATAMRPRLRYAPLFGALSELFDLGDSDLASIFERAADAGAWAKSPIPGTELLHLVGGPRVAGADNGLVRLRAGARFPMHRHLGSERVLVLEGGYEDEQSGRSYQPGDVHHMPAGSSHAYRALPGRDLLFAVSVVEGVDVEGFGILSPSSV
jgi:quercetin dioxygenase-like cupin family protein